MIRRGQSKNIEDRRVKGDRLLSSSSTKDAANEALRNYYGSTGQNSRQSRENANRLGLGPSLEAITNEANSVQARRRTRFTKGTDGEVVKSLTKRKS